MITAALCIGSFTFGFCFCSWIDRKHYAHSLPPEKAWSEIYREFLKEM